MIGNCAVSALIDSRGRIVWRWLHDVVRDPDVHVQPLYGSALEREPTEYQVTILPGYAGMGQVRVGNQAFDGGHHHCAMQLSAPWDTAV